MAFFLFLTTNGGGGWMGTGCILIFSVIGENLEFLNTLKVGPGVDYFVFPMVPLTYKVLENSDEL